jgi:eukaryotic-like serine/threonine-protein kinase
MSEAPLPGNTAPDGQPQSTIATGPLVQQLVADLRQRRRQGEPVLVESYLEQYPTLRADAEAAVDLIYNEILLREEAGEEPVLAEYVRRFPQWANQLQLQFEVERALQPDRVFRQTQRDVWETVLPFAPFLPTATSGPPTIPGYEALGELGRGGMGIVYKARHVQLNRTVALKMMLPGTFAGVEERARFRTEAEAVARLQHPNIVQIFEVGEHNGQPWFALEFVAGGSLADRLPNVPLLPRQAAELVETLARAMDHAHQQGIVHRDLKPANVLLQVVGGQWLVVGENQTANRDGPTTNHQPPTTIPKITDFGLAKKLDTPGHTHAGAVMGTPSYMAPEQASGRASQVGPAADIYALGVILYEVLTSRPPFLGSTALETLDQVRSQEPAPPARLRPGTPRDLETICLKCLQKEPERRYRSARELADDLRRFLAGQPILARRIGVAERARKWVRRQPALAALLATIVLALVSLAVGGWWSAAALRAAAQREEHQRRQAEASFAQALDAVERLLTRVGAEELADVPQMAPVRKKLLLDAQEFYQKFLAERGDDPTVRHLAARAYGRLGDIQELLGEHAAAEQHYRQAIALEESSAAEPAQRQELARTSNNLGLLLKKLGRLPEAAQVLEQALSQRQQLADDYPDRPAYRHDLAASHSDLATVLTRRPGQRAQADQNYRRALTLQEELAKAYRDQPVYQQELARTLNRLAILTCGTDWTEAEQTFRRAIDIQMGLVKQYSDAPAYRRDLAHTWNNLAGAQRMAGHRRQAEKTYRVAQPLLAQLTADFPTVLVYRHELATLHNDLGMVLEEVGQPAEAENAYRAALALRLQLTGTAPEVPDYRHKLAVVYLGLGSVRESRGQSHQAEADYRQARAILDKLSAEVPNQPAFHSERGNALGHLADLLFKRTQPTDLDQHLELLLRRSSGNPLDALVVVLRAQAALAEARHCLEQAVSSQWTARVADPENARYRQALHEHCYSLAETQLHLGNHAGAAAAASELPVLYPEEANSYVTAAEFLARCVSLAADTPRLSEANRRELVDLYGRQAVGLLEKAVARGFRDIDELKKLPAYDPLRRRPDFKKLLDAMEKAKPVRA